MERVLRWARGAGASLARQVRAIVPGQYQGHLLGAPVLSGVTVTPQTALGLTAFFDGVNVISSDIAKLPLGLYRRQKGGGQALVTGDPRQRLVSHKANPESNSVRYRQHSMGRVLGWGNDYSRIVRDGDNGIPVALVPFDPSTTLPMRDDRSKALYYLDNQTGIKHRPEDILHIAGLGFDGIMGYCPVTLHRQALGLSMASEQFGAALFGNGAIPKGMLKTPKRLGDVAAKRLRDTFYEQHGGPQNAHRMAVLEEGMEWVNTQINPDDAQFLATRQFQVVEIARMLNLPPNKLKDYSQAHLANVEEANLDYLTSNLQSWLEAIEAELNSKLLFADEVDRLYFKHDMSALLRGNMAARTTRNTAMRNAGAISADDWRVSEGMNPIGPEKGGDKYLVQAQYQPLERAGQPLPTPEAPKPPPMKRTVRTAPERRHNPHHDHATGKFSSGNRSSQRRGPEAHAAEVQARVADRRHAGKKDVGSDVHQSRVDHKADRKDKADEIKGQRKSQGRDQRKEVKDLDREHASERKGLRRDQHKEVKEQAREQAREVRGQEREQAKDQAHMDRRHGREAEKTTVPEKTAARHEREKADLAAEHETARKGQAEDHAGDREGLASEHAHQHEAQAIDHAMAHEELAEGHQFERVSHGYDAKNEIDSLRDDHRRALVQSAREDLDTRRFSRE